MKTMKTSMKFLMCLIIALAFAANTSCKKDSLEDAVLPQTVEGEQGVSGTNGQNGEDGEQGEQGESGTSGTDGQDGAQGENGADGQDGANGADGQDGAQGETGTNGQDGVAGLDGAQGETGTTGTNGTNGEDGNANVIASEWFEPKESDFSVNNPAYKGLPIATGIGLNVQDNAVILVYYDTDVNIRLLPSYSFDTSGEIIKTVNTHINHASRTIYVTIQKFGSDLTAREYLWNASGPAYGKGVRFRYVIIPGSTSSKIGTINFKKMPYKEVMDHFGLDY